VVDAEVVGAPVDQGLSLCQPRLAEEEVVVFEGVYKWVGGGGVLLTCEGDVGSVGRKGARAVRKDDEDGRRRVKRDCVFLNKRRADHITLSSTINEDVGRVTIDVADEGEKGGLGLFDSKGRYTNTPFSQSTDFVLGQCRHDRCGLRYRDDRHGHRHRHDRRDWGG